MRMPWVRKSFDESKHPRADDGKFGSGSGHSGGKSGSSDGGKESSPVEFGNNLAQSLGVKSRVQVVSGDEEPEHGAVGAGYSEGGGVRLRDGFLNRVASYDTKAHAEAVERRKELIPNVEEEIAKLKSRVKTAKGKEKKSLSGQIREREEVLNELKYSARTFAWETGETPEERVRTVTAHELGHAFDSEYEVNLPEAIREVGGVSDADRYKISTYAASHPSEMFAELVALKHTGRWDEVPESLQRAYEIAMSRVQRTEAKSFRHPSGKNPPLQTQSFIAKTSSASRSASSILLLPLISRLDSSSDSSRLAFGSIVNLQRSDAAGDSTSRIANVKTIGPWGHVRKSFDESEHPRAIDGRFGSKPGDGGGSGEGGSGSLGSLLSEADPMHDPEYDHSVYADFASHADSGSADDGVDLFRDAFKKSLSERDEWAARVMEQTGTDPDEYESRKAGVVAAAEDYKDKLQAAADAYTEAAPLLAEVDVLRHASLEVEDYGYRPRGDTTEWEAKRAAAVDAAKQKRRAEIEAAKQAAEPARQAYRTASRAAKTASQALADADAELVEWVTGRVGKRIGPWGLVTKEAGRWITIGGKKGSDGERSGGTPVYIVNGRITRGHPSLTGRKLDNLKDAPEDAPKKDRGRAATKRQQGAERAAQSRRENKESHEYAAAVWRKKARKEDHDPRALQSLAQDIKAHHDAFASERRDMLQDAREYSKKNGFGDLQRRGKDALAGGKEDASSVRGFDQTTEFIQQRYPHHFKPETGEHGSHSDQLHAMLTEGHPELMDWDAAYSDAFDALGEPGKHDDPDDASDLSFDFGANVADEDEIPKGIRLPWVRKAAGHDVSDEKRDDHGRWTAGGRSSGSGESHAGLSAVARKRELHETPLKEHIRDQRRIAGYDDAKSHSELREAAAHFASVAPKLVDLERLTDHDSIEYSKRPPTIDKLIADKRRPEAVRHAAERYLVAREAVHHALRHRYSSAHEHAVEQALKAGKHVPDDVLADYPELAAKHGVRGQTRIVDPAGPMGKSIVGPWVTKAAGSTYTGVSFGKYFVNGEQVDRETYLARAVQQQPAAGSKPDMRSNPDLEAAWGAPAAPAKPQPQGGDMRHNPALDAFMADTDQSAPPSPRPAPPAKPAKPGKRKPAAPKQPGHSSKLPADRGKVTIRHAATALHQMGYSLGRGTFDPQSKTTSYEVTGNGQTRTMTAGQIKDMLYAAPKTKPASPAPAPTPAAQPQPAAAAPASKHVTDGVSYRPSQQAIDAGDEMVEVDLSKLDSAWQKDQGYHVPPGGDPRNKGKYENAVNFLRGHKGQVDAPRLHLDDSGTVSFTDGRHRAAASRDLGRKSMFVTVDPANADAVRQKLGRATPAPQPAATPTKPVQPRSPASPPAGPAAAANAPAAKPAAPQPPPLPQRKPGAQPPPLPARAQPPALPHARTQATALSHANAVVAAAKSGDRAGLQRAHAAAKQSLQSHLTEGLRSIDRMAAQKYPNDRAQAARAAAKAKDAFRRKVATVRQRLDQHASGGVGKSLVWAVTWDMDIGGVE